MKKIIAILFLLSSVSGWAQSNDLPICSGDGVQFIYISSTQKPSQATIQNKLNQYSNYSRGNRYELCFVFSADLKTETSKPLIDGAPLNVPSNADKPIVVSGLYLKRASDNPNKSLPIFISDGTEVILHNDKFTCATNSKPSSIGIKLLGDAHQVINSEIKNCGTGIQVGDPSTGSGQAGVEGNNMQIGPGNQIHDNNRAVVIANGTRNFVQQNSIT